MHAHVCTQILQTIHTGNIMLPITLVHSVDSATANISTFNGILNSGRHPDVSRLLPHVQSWYVIEADGGYLFGPSKFIGYANMTADLYVQETGAAGRLDGRVTEKKMAGWATPITSDDERHEVLHTALARFCADYGAFPNKRARISLFERSRECQVTEAEQVKALSVLIATLSSNGKRDLKRLAFS
jgi:hypothetical protein